MVKRGKDAGSVACLARERPRTPPRAGHRPSGCLAQSCQLWRLGELLQRPLLELRSPLGGEAEALADGGQRLWLLAAGAEAQRQDLALGIRQLRDRAVHNPLALVLVGDFLGRLLVGWQ